MSRILIYLQVYENGEYDIDHRTTTQGLRDSINTHYNGVCPNMGNKLWFAGIISEISTPENIIEFWDGMMQPDEINDRYDLIIAPMANIFSSGYSALMERIACRYVGIKIPIYVIACGIQADNNQSIDELVGLIQKPAYQLMKNVYDTGGEFALRGWRTKEFFDKMGFYSAVVTGCPSLYQNGRDIIIRKESIAENQLRIAFHGDLRICFEQLKKHDDNIFFDQETYYEPLYLETALKKSLWDLVRQYGYDAVYCMTRGQIQLITDLDLWKAYLVKGKFNFAFGTRIHGSIMPILSGIPALIYARDARVQEIADFYSIPTVSEIDTGKRMIDLYEKTDYSIFLRDFPEKFDTFERFLQNRGIVKQINCQNPYLHNASTCNTNYESAMPNQHIWDKMKPNFERLSPCYLLWSTVLDKYRQIRGA